MPSRLPEYRRLLARASELGYRLISVEQWAELLKSTPSMAEGGTRLLVLRHDVDTDAAFTLLSRQVELEFGASASYFYRQSTMDARVIEAVMRDGFHVSYHFEELADVAKKRGLRDAQAVRARMGEIQELFASNLQRLRQQFGWSARIVCSHGDWINRRLGLRNLALLDDPVFRARVNVEHETYDAPLMDPLRGYYTDAQPPIYWRKSGSPVPALEAGLTPLGLLTHPRQWRPSPLSNTAETGRRVAEGLSYRFQS